MALERSQASLYAASNVTHSAIVDRDSSRVAHCTLYSALYSGRFQRKILRITTQSRYDTVPCCVQDITCKSETSCNCDLGRAAAGVQCGDIHYLNCVYLRETKIARPAVLLGETMASHKYQYLSLENENLRFRGRDLSASLFSETQSNVTFPSTSDIRQQGVLNMFDSLTYKT